MMLKLLLPPNTLQQEQQEHSIKPSEFKTRNAAATAATKHVVQQRQQKSAKQVVRTLAKVLMLHGT
jgi:hypothetical protein